MYLQQYNLNIIPKKLSDPCFNHVGHRSWLLPPALVHPWRCRWLALCQQLWGPVMPWPQKKCFIVIPIFCVSTRFSITTLKKLFWETEQSPNLRCIASASALSARKESPVHPVPFGFSWSWHKPKPYYYWPTTAAHQGHWRFLPFCRSRSKFRASVESLAWWPRQHSLQLKRWGSGPDQHSLKHSPGVWVDRATLVIFIPLL